MKPNVKSYPPPPSANRLHHRINTWSQTAQTSHVLYDAKGTHRNAEIYRYELGTWFYSAQQVLRGRPHYFQGEKRWWAMVGVDFRGLNAVWVEPLYSLPLLKDLLSTLAIGKIFTKFNLQGAYYQVRI